MTETVITCRLDLVIQLIDTTTGKAIRERNVRFAVGDKALRFYDRGDASYIMINSGRDDFCLKVSAFGYEETSVPIEYNILDSILPSVEVYLLPLYTKAVGSNVTSLQGVLPGIEAIEAVTLGATCLNVKEFDERKRTITVLNPHKLELRDVHYGIVNHEHNRYEHVKTVKNISENVIKIDRTLSLEQADTYSMTRIIFGMVKPDGTYFLRVREDSSNSPFLIKYQVKGTEKFQVMNCMELTQKELK